MKRLLLTILIISLAGFALAQNTTKLKSNLTIEKSAPMLYLNGTSAGIDFYNGDVTLQQSSNTLTLGGGNFSLGTNSLLGTGSIGATGTRLLKGWFTDLEITNLPTVNGAAFKTALALTASDVGLGNVTNESKATMFTNPTFTGTLYTAGNIIPTQMYGNTALGTSQYPIGNIIINQGNGISWNNTYWDPLATDVSIFESEGGLDIWADSLRLVLGSFGTSAYPVVLGYFTDLNIVNRPTITTGTLATTQDINDSLDYYISGATVGVAAADSNAYGGYTTRTYVESLLGDGAGLSAQRLPFIVNVTAGAPSAADSTATHPEIAGKHIDVYRDGAKQYQNFTATNTVEGFRVNGSTITVNPVWQANEQVLIDIIQPVMWSYLSFTNTGELSDSLLSYWKMDEASGNLIDALGYKNLTISGAPTPQQTGKINYCWSYDGVDDFHGVNDTLSLNHRDKFTASAWVKTATTTSDGSIIGAIDGAGNTWGWKLSCSATQTYLTFYDGTTSYVRVVATDIADQAWHHVAATYNGTTAQLYIDGSPAGAALTAEVAYAAYAFFRINRSDGSYLDASIDNAAYWHKCLDSTEIAALYAAENAGLEYPWN